MTWRSADRAASVVLDDSGVTRRGAVDAPEHVAWSQVTGVGLLLPTAASFAYRMNTVLARVGPVPYEYAPHGVVITVSTARGVLVWDLGRSRRYPWRLAFGGHRAYDRQLTAVLDDAPHLP
ncbi:hypothetical protein [Cellulomonas sp. PhB150]|uniref:hypothetical protein n=1 Tax=Cellulomonas sp. PhB150 TaxID=2485188 RepID=UPI0011CE8A56|nr:hypothetical protein [Cellulomonas sp. PhB150]